MMLPSVSGSGPGHTSISGRRVVRELTALITQRGKPGMFVSGNGTELTSNAACWLCAERSAVALRNSGESDAERLRRELQWRMRDELLNETLFMSLAHARVEIASLVEDYNRVRPHSSLGYSTPAAFAAELDKQWTAPLSPFGLHYAAHCFNRAHAQQRGSVLIPA